MNGEVTPRLLAISLGGWLFAALAALGVVTTLRNAHRHGWSVPRAHSLLVSLAALGLCVWLWQIDLLGIQLWAY